jgi:hypothetical protein
MIKSEIKELFQKELDKRGLVEWEDNPIWDRFSKWMRGQTVGMTPEGEIDYYDHDVHRFIELALDGIPTYFD